MDLLDGYKKAWDNQSEETNKVSKVDIYKMAHSKSSSIVKKIFIIGILELIFWATINIFFTGSSYGDIYEELHLNTIVTLSIYLHYLAIILFLVLFYKNYKSISISDNTKSLIAKILNTRKTVQYYVYFNLGYLILANIVVMCFVFSDLDGLIQYYNNHGINTSIANKTQLLVSLIVAMVFILSFMFLILWLFYKIVYGSLIKRLNKNYQELVKLDDNS
ncbi:hypothetical protein WH52_10175 [Tenacibaculum holothuriorum]|uniref:Beta-carotene 15,15'-monooxygenase n=1 Tax=Tenacibaculum holothuriorum TaxID=1635173 RepID=A0A1Y2PBF3_9FLAO|nr:hypothetical protein [Tenacibaculum holothuriorum]OSY87782.1 hypothetical protein WH52_10175 [Tenacibaculum holothuriorum]